MSVEAKNNAGKIASPQPQEIVPKKILMGSSKQSTVSREEFFQLQSRIEILEAQVMKLQIELSKLKSKQ
jgi:polyhydroxyalkanoate synthesis regulator phasin